MSPTTGYLGIFLEYRAIYSCNVDPKIEEVYEQTDDDVVNEKNKIRVAKMFDFFGFNVFNNYFGTSDFFREFSSESHRVSGSTFTCFFSWE